MSTQEKFPFTEQELNHLQTTAGFFYGSSDMIWVRAFSFYNQYNEKKLSMSCKPCFHKVYQFISYQYNSKKWSNE